MMINRKMVALFTAAIVGAGLAACQRAGEDKSASSQDSPMNQAPKQGYTGPASPTTSPPYSSGGMAAPAPGMSAPQGAASGEDQTGSPGSTTPGTTQKQPGSSSQDQPQQQQQ